MAQQDMRKPFIAMWVGIGTLVISWLFPPWTFIIDKVDPRHPTRHAVATSFSGFRNVLLPHEVWSDNRTFQIDVEELLVIDIGIAAITAAAMLSLRPKTERN